jgi:hypothetical protein
LQEGEEEWERHPGRRDRLIAENEKEEDAKKKKKKNALEHGLAVSAKKKFMPAPVKALLQPSR